MSDERAFLDHIIAHPDDDAPRLVFADWLDEHGRHDRAEFIRVQCELAHLPAWDARRVRLELREAVLRERLERELAAELPDLPERRGRHSYQRGFLESLWFDSFAALRDRLPAWAAAVPLAEAAVLWWRGEGELTEVAAVPGLRALTVRHGPTGEEDAARLADSPLLGTLHTLTVERNGIGEPALRRLLASPHLRRLRVLRVPYTTATDRVPRLLADADLPLLAELDLSGAIEYAEDAVDAAAALADLAAWPGLVRLRALTLNGNAVGADGLRTLLASPHAAGLKSLSVRASGLDADACAAFADATPGLRLDTLDIGDNPFDNDGAAALAGAACLSELKELTIDRCEIGPAGAAELAAASFMATLHVLRAETNSFGPAGLRAILAAAPTNLHTLTLSANDIGDDGLTSFVGGPPSDGFVALGLGEPAHFGNLLRILLASWDSSVADWEMLSRSPLGQRLGDALSREVPF